MNPEVCVVWVSSDVLMCSASIWHMCTMSMDRYFTLKYPMRYGRNKTRSMVAGKILFVWVVSMAISSPVCIYGFIDTTSVFINGECVPTLKDFVIYGSIFAFYIPLFIMIVTYVLTIRILWKNQLRMRNIDRSDLKPRLAQLTAQCTGFAIPKLLTSLRKPSRSPSLSTSGSRTNGMKQLLEPNSSGLVNNKTNGNFNEVISEADVSEDGESEGRRTHAGVTYLAPPSPQTFTSRSPSPASTNLVLYSDTEESESEPNYFSLLQTNHSCRSLCTPISLTTSEKSLQKRLQKKQLYQQQQQELQLLQHDYHQHRQFQRNREGNAVASSSPSVKEKIQFSSQDPADCSPSDLIALSPPLSPLFDEGAEKQQQQPLLPKCPTTPLLPLSSTSKLSSKSVTTEVTAGKKPSKKKRYSKRCKKRRNSLIQNSGQTQHLKVPGQLSFRHGLCNKQTSGQTLLLSAVSDTQVSQAGRGMKSEDGHYPDESSFHLCHSKDYKSVEWDRRYFQIQEEMDRCLKGEFGRCERHQPKQEQSRDDLLKDTKNETIVKDSERKTLLKPEVSLPIRLETSLTSDCLFPNGYSHSAPNSPLNRRNPDFLKMTSSSDDDREYDVDNENTSDKNDDEDTSGSSNSDVVTIRLHPPTPKVKSSCGSTNRNHLLNDTCLLNNDNVADESVHSVISITVPTDNSLNLNYPVKIDNSLMLNSPPKSDTSLLLNCHVKTYNSPSPKKSVNTEHLNGFSQFACDTESSTIHNSSLLDNLKSGTSVQNLSPAGTPIPEMVISSEGEMTLEETDDTLDDSPKHQRIKLRRPCQMYSNKNKYGKNYSPESKVLRTDNLSKFKQSSFRNTFRMHKGKRVVKHILSKKTATNEKKASKVLGIIFLVFVVLWTPFFAVNILNATCQSCMTGMSKEVMSLFLWMGYIASLANPIIYTMFNTAFRRTFIKILTCKIQRTCRIKTSDTPHMSYTTMLASERRNTVTVVLRDESR